jgi:hypothetical protein
MRKLSLIVLFIISGIMYSCTKDSEEVGDKSSQDSTGKNSGGISAGGLEFKVEYDKPRQIYSIENKDLDNDGNDEVIVLSVIKDQPGDQYMDYYNFDLMQVFAKDSTGKEFVKIASDTVDYGEELIYEDMQRNFTYQLLVKTNTGGNDVYASKGMFVYDLKPGNDLKMIKYIEFGNPEVKDLNSDGNKEIIVTDSYWGTMPGQDVIYYTKDIFGMDGGELKRKNAQFKKYYDEKIDAAQVKYNDQKAKVQKGEKIKPAEYPFYTPVVEIFVNYMSEENNAGIITFWNSEKDFLKKNLPEDQYTDLENFVTRIVPVVENI